MTGRPTVVFPQPPLADNRARLAGAARLIVNESGSAWTPAQLREACAGADALVAFMTERVDTALLDASPRLRLVAGALKGYDNLDVATCSERGVWVTAVPDQLTVPTAELTLGLVIGLARHLRAADEHVRSGAFRGWEPRFYGTGLAGNTVGIVGMGAIGRAVARRLLAFDARVAYTDERPLAPDDPLAGECEHRSLDGLLADSGIVILAAPLTPESHHLINAERLARMRPGALLVNPGRGSVVDEVAVAEALRDGHLGGYAADVFEMEDLSRDDRPERIPPALLEHPCTLFAPHLGSAVTDVRRSIERHAVDNVRRVLLEGIDPVDAVNRPRTAPTGAC